MSNLNNNNNNNNNNSSNPFVIVNSMTTEELRAVLEAREQGYSGPTNMPPGVGVAAAAASFSVASMAPASMSDRGNRGPAGLGLAEALGGTVEPTVPVVASPQLQPQQQEQRLQSPFIVPRELNRTLNPFGSPSVAGGPPSLVLKDTTKSLTPCRKRKHLEVDEPKTAAEREELKRRETKKRVLKQKQDELSVRKAKKVSLLQEASAEEEELVKHQARLDSLQLQKDHLGNVKEAAKQQADKDRDTAKRLADEERDRAWVAIDDAYDVAVADIDPDLEVAKESVMDSARKAKKAKERVIEEDGEILSLQARIGNLKEDLL